MRADSPDLSTRHSTDRRHRLEFPQVRGDSTTRTPTKKLRPEGSKALTSGCPARVAPEESREGAATSRVVIAQSVPDAVRAAEGVDGWLRVGGETGLLCLLQELQGLGGVGGGVANGLPGDPGDGADTVRVVSKPN